MTVAADVLWGQAPQTYQPTITELATTCLLSFLNSPNPSRQAWETVLFFYVNLVSGELVLFLVLLTFFFVS